MLSLIITVKDTNEVWWDLEKSLQTNACIHTKPGKWEIMYMYVGLIRFASVPIRLWNIYDSVALFAFHFINYIQNQKIDNA